MEMLNAVMEKPDIYNKKIEETRKDRNKKPDDFDLKYGLAAVTLSSIFLCLQYFKPSWWNTRENGFTIAFGEQGGNILLDLVLIHFFVTGLWFLYSWIYKTYFSSDSSSK